MQVYVYLYIPVYNVGLWSVSEIASGAAIIKLRTFCARLSVWRPF
jgi:hypothetical protein